MTKNKPLAKVLHFDSYGKRQEKYDRLENTSVSSVGWKELELKEPYYFFVPKDFAAEEKYNKGILVAKIFGNYSSGIETAKDPLIIKHSFDEIKKLEDDFKVLDISELEKKYQNFSSAKLAQVKNDIINCHKIDYLYKPFDTRLTLYSINSQGVLWRPRSKIMDNIVNKKNISLNITSKNRQLSLGYVFISKVASDRHMLDSSADSMSVFPLYLYAENQEQLIEDNLPHKRPNIDGEIVQEIEKKLGLSFVYDIDDDYSECKTGAYFTPENLLDYIYAVLHSKRYREAYKEFLKIDFPRVPFDVSKKVFFEMAKLGEELRSWHLLENEKLIPQNFLTDYPVDGDNLVEKIRFEENTVPINVGDVTEGQGELVAGKVFINESQYFDGVPKNVYEFYIGGYQPAQKWLKDRKGRELQYEDIVHYGKIILTLSETLRIMGEIEGVFEV